MTTQDGYDWPNGCGDECWPEPHDRGAVSSHLCEQATDLQAADAEAQAFYRQHVAEILDAAEISLGLPPPMHS